MHTDDLAEMLGRNAEAETVGRPARWWALAVAGGVAATAGLMLITLGLQPRLATMIETPAWLGKAGFGLAMALAGLAAATRLARPGAARPWLIALALAPLALLWLAAAIQLLGAPAELRAELVMGRTWRECPWRVASLSVPALVGALLVLRRMAPTRPRLAGAAAGLFAGGVGAAVYAFHCPELAPAFVAVWYVAGVLTPTTFGALIGPRVLRW
ncbi:MAG: DUF1109 domain-containing protein [Phenylobacterium sp.]|uniref:DUF1109 domain-containing protein n=1 Tax=Phenylobacterium sp. TaxID=1871053 RepID=UPI0027337D82|nr:DUF1109 domain-containing protein [Phenylobacterium sp.]MDP3745466.1 DUF1109 domain-containing protein [Phenylobacterium sp.]